jgi:hypothetical protein
MVISHFKRLELVLVVGFFLMISSVALSVAVMVDFFQKTSNKLDVLVQDAYASNTTYDVNLIEYINGSATHYCIPAEKQTLASGIKEYNDQCSLECAEECPDSIRIMLLQTIFDQQEVLKDTMIYK